MQCKHCNTELGSVRFCRKCGAPAGGFAQNAPQPMQQAPYGAPHAPPARGQGNKWMVVLATMLGTAAVLALILHLALPDGLGGLFGPPARSGFAEGPDSMQQPIAPIAPVPTPAPAAPTVRAGDIIQFGPWDWRVLEVRGSQALILTDRVIAERAYHDTQMDVTWETSDIRRWLNGDFLAANFTAEEQARITITTVANSDNPWFGTGGGNDTQDRVFLLSIDEVLRYFGDSGLVAQGAALGHNARIDQAPAWPNHGIYSWGIHDRYSGARIERNFSGDGSRWWLRSPGFIPESAASVDGGGILDLIGRIVSLESVAPRPALWLNLGP